MLISFLMIDYVKFFPYDEMRPEQDSVLKEIAKNWDNKKYYILQLDVGTGKSGIAKTVANWSKNAFIITETKQLQQQYIYDFGKDSEFVSIKGKANYSCNKNPRLNCENGPCTLRKDVMGMPSCMKTCKYYSLREKALRSHTVLTSYAYLFRAFDCSGFWKKRNLMVFDECHLIEDQLVNFASFEINPMELDKTYGLFDRFTNRKELMKPFTLDGWENNKERILVIYDIVKNKRDELFNMLKEVIGDLKVEELDEDTIDSMNSIHKLYYKIDKLYRKMDVFNTQRKDNWIISPSKVDGALTFTPLFVDSLFNSFCNNWADKFLFMSATILDIDGFINDLGIDKDQCIVIKVESTFDPNKSPIYYMPCGKMNYQSIDESIPRACEAISMILQSKRNEKGIIHTGNYKVAEKIWNDFEHIQNYDHERLLMKAKDNDEISNQNLINVHTRSLDTVLVSPSMTTGVDLKDDLSRFQVIVKMPFSSLGDPRTKKKTDISPDWYACQMLKNLIQACGRSTRSVDDHSSTYVLDSSFAYYINKYKKWLPKQFLARLRNVTIT